MTTSAAWGRPVQHSWLTVTTLLVPTLSTLTNPTSARRLMWCEQVDWLISSCSAMSPIRMKPWGAVATAYSARTRVGSARQANHSA